jgi:ketosteroid isomerase-like protein
MIETPTALTESNRRTIRQAFDAWQDGTGAIADVLDSDVVWRIEGRSLASKTYGNKQQLVDELLVPFGERFSSSDPFRPAKIRSVHADGDTVIVVWDGHGTDNDGQTYENSYAWIMRMHDGRVIDATAFYDGMSFDDVWTRVQPQSDSSRVEQARRVS